ncbi:transporter substrate-binding domain-containing protein [Litoribacillus peritrichatus]|uniref:Transporter substrate-binding domain-containing protein n=2 Tax=Litoribacillus peritrichatus TaxID=718191 RepID=A0ABP7MTP1_9GAMM
MRIMKQIKWFLWGVLGIWLPSLLFAREVMISTVDRPPYISSALNDFGPFAEITRAAFLETGHTVRIEFFPWMRALEEVKLGRVDMMLAAYDTAARRRQFIYSNQIYEATNFVIGLKENGVKGYDQLSDLSEFTFGVTRGYAYSKEFMAATALNRQEALSPLTNLRKLFSKRIHFVVMDYATFKEDLKKIPKKEQKPHILLTPPLSVNGFFNLFSRNIEDAPQLVDDFNRGLEVIKKNGQYNAIIKRFNVSPAHSGE